MAITKEDLITLSGSSELIENRIEIWETYGNAQESVSKLEKFSVDFDDPHSESLNSPLSINNTPHEEVDAAIAKINQEMKNMQIAKSDIQGFQNDIQRVKKNFIMIVASGIIFLLAIIGILLA